MCVHAYVCACMHVCVVNLVRAITLAPKRMLVAAHTHAHTHTHTHTHTRTHGKTRVLV